MSGLCFEAIADHPAGTLLGLLERAYAPLAEAEPELFALWRGRWREFDGFIYGKLETAGRCGFVSTEAGVAVGFASWDPRGHPVARIGHHVVVPEAQGRGYGSAQLREMFRRLRADGFGQAEATTGQHAFFAPARRLYLACGFHLTGSGVNPDGFPTLHYALALASMPDR